MATPLSHYFDIFGGGGRGGGFVTAGYSGGGGGGAYIGGTSGHWVRLGVSVGNSETDWGWRWVEATASRIRPVVLDLDGDGVELTDAQNSPGFDFFGEGLVKTMGWFAGGDALLVHDANGNGFVDNGAEISFIHHAPGSTSDLQALRVFDVNGNGWLDPGDGAYPQFRLWRDANFNGISDPGELSTLQALGVQSINLHGTGGGYQVAGNDIVGTAAFARTDGTSGTAYDVGFAAFSRGTRLVGEDVNWAIIETENSEQLGVFKHGTSVTIGSLGTFEVNGDTRTGYQLGDGSDSVSTGTMGNRAFYLDTAGGDDMINLSSSYHGSVIKAGAGNDGITGSQGDDFISTGPGRYDWVRDWQGDDYHIIQSNHSTIYDHAGTDVAVFERLSFSNVEFWYEGGNVVVSSLDGTQRHWIMDMMFNPGMGVEYAMFQDRTLSREELIGLAELGGPRGFDARPVEPDADLVSGSFIGQPQLGGVDFYG